MLDESFKKQIHQKVISPNETKRHWEGNDDPNDVNNAENKTVENNLDATDVKRATAAFQDQGNSKHNAE